MRNRSNSGIRLDYFQRLVKRSILKFQNPATGLISSRDDTQHSWVRDNVYSILSVWGLALAYRKTADLDEDRAKAYELEMAVVMLMRGLLRSMMMQCDKLEKFKISQSPRDSLHAKYCTRTGKTVVGDTNWDHLQIDATSVYLLTLAQMTASGLNIIFTLDEVAFIQNLVFYIETAYRTPDYGIWERGDKTNHGVPELNSSSIGMAKAALEAINELDLFAARGGPASVIHVLPDEAQRCQAILMSMLPRESSSKEVDSGLMTVIGFPAFAVDDPAVIKETREFICEKLSGKYGFIRFLRDGYKTPKEDTQRLHYEPSELMQFEKIESQWPLFFALNLLNGLFRNDKEQVEIYKKRLDDVMLKSEDGLPLMPELYALPAESVEKEKSNPNSQPRIPTGQKPHMWGQSLYILSRLIYENFISPGELDPLNRRQIREVKPDVVVQVVILAEDREIANSLDQHGIQVQTMSETAPIQVHPARVLSQIFSRLGKNKRLGLTGRPSGEIGLLATSKLYMLGNKIFAFIPQFMDQQRFYVVLDTNFLIDFLRTEVAYLKSSWKELGRPTITFVVTHSLIDNCCTLPAALIGTLKKLQTGYISGTRVHMGKLSDFLTTSCMTQLDFLRDQDDPSQKEAQLMDFMDTIMSPTCPRPHLLSTAPNSRRISRGVSGKAVSGIVRRSRSIQIDADQIPDQIKKLRAKSPVSKKPLLTTISSIGSDLSVSQDVKSESPPDFQKHSSFSSSVYIPSARSSPIEEQEEEDASKSTFRSLSPSRSGSPSQSRRMSFVHFVSRFGHETIESDLSSKDQARAMEHHRFWPFTDSDENLRSESPQIEHLKSAVNSSYDHNTVTPSIVPVIQRSTLDKSDVNITELLDNLKESESLQEQADIIHYLYTHKGLNWDTGIDSHRKCTVRDLLVELYEKAGHWKQWWLIRHAAGMLKKRVEDLAIAATDLVVRQKQLSVGLPPNREHIITCPLPPDELANIIFCACGEDSSTASLTQELLIYLAMFIRTEPKLFSEMLRLRVGLIIQVMASEMARTLKCTGDEASDHLLNLSPFEMKTLLHHILSGKEFHISTTYQISPAFDSEHPKHDEAKETEDQPHKLSIVSKHSKYEMKEVVRISRKDKVVSQSDLDVFAAAIDSDEKEGEEDDRQGQWLRRRRLDGALNRVPVGFYPRIWRVLRRCLALEIDDTKLFRSLTEEMTEGEFKFALEVEIVLNQLPEPEYRQLMVEAMMILATLVENDNSKISMDQCIRVDDIVMEANRIFIADQKMSKEHEEAHMGARGICQHLYDSAPSGPHGTMTFMCRALARILKLPISNGDLECVIS